jgi:hypothetical protein
VSDASKTSSGAPGTTKREQVLDGAKSAVMAARNKVYGHPSDNFRTTAMLFTVALEKKLRPFQQITAAEVAQILRFVKEARLTNSADHLDSHIDIAGYAACGMECHGDEAKHDVVAFPVSAVNGEKAKIFFECYFQGEKLPLDKFEVVVNKYLALHAPGKKMVLMNVVDEPNILSSDTFIPKADAIEGVPWAVEAPIVVKEDPDFENAPRSEPPRSEPPRSEPEPLTDADIVELDSKRALTTCAGWMLAEFCPWLVLDARGRIVFRAEGPGADRDAAFVVACGRRMAALLDLIHGLRSP